MNRLVKRTGEKPSLWKRIKDIAFTDARVLAEGLDEGSLEAIEALLLAADFGVPATMRLVDEVEKQVRAGRLRTESDFRSAVESEIRAILKGSAGSAGASAASAARPAPADGAKPAARAESGRGGTPATGPTTGTRTELRFADAGTTVYLIVGVNGVGKTTTIGKLAHRLKKQGRKPLLAAADTFRAGAIDQLRVWAERVGAEFVGGAPGADPAAVAFDALDAAESRGADVVLIDTAGRLHTQTDLMTELKKVDRVVARKREGAPHETLLVLDATVGQNAVAQARTFSESLTLTGLVLAKLDSTARGGIVVALKQEFDLPVKLVGTGESVDALEPFDADRFAHDVLTG